MTDFVYLPKEECYVGRDGTILSKDKVLINPFNQTRKHLQIGITVGKVRTKYLVHRLVAKAYLGLDNDNDVVSHINKDFEDCHVDNLVILTRKEAINGGKRSPGRKPKLTVQQVLELKRANPKGLLRATYAERYGVSLCSIKKILSGATWTHVTLQ